LRESSDQDFKLLLGLSFGFQVVKCPDFVDHAHFFVDPAQEKLQDRHSFFKKIIGGVI